MNLASLTRPVERLSALLGQRLDRIEAALCRFVGAERKKDRLLVGVAFNFALVMMVVLPIDLLFRYLTQAENSLLPLQRFITWFVYRLESGLGVDVEVGGEYNTVLRYSKMIDLEIVSSCTGLHETIFLALLVLCFRGVQPRVRFKWAGIFAVFIFLENIFRITMGYPMNQQFGPETWERFHFFWWHTGQYALVMAVFLLWVMVVAGNPKHRSLPAAAGGEAGRRAGTEATREDDGAEAGAMAEDASGNGAGDTDAADWSEAAGADEPLSEAD